MSHPFELGLTSENVETSQLIPMPMIRPDLGMTTMALGEEGGQFTTHAIGEEGGNDWDACNFLKRINGYKSPFSWLDRCSSSNAVKIEDNPRSPNQTDTIEGRMTTMALGEEGGHLDSELKPEPLERRRQEEQRQQELQLKQRREQERQKRQKELERRRQEEQRREEREQSDNLFTTQAVGEEGGDDWGDMCNVLEQDFPWSLSSCSGETQDNPILPGRVEAIDGENRFSFIDVPRGRWFDPPTTFGFRYEMTSDSLFTSILDFPTGFDNPFTVSVEDTILGHFSPGDRANFVTLLGTGVSEFSLTGISPLVDENDPMAFPLKLDFSTEKASFDMYSIHASDSSVTTPESSLIFSLLCFGVLSLRFWKKSPKS
ncbi:MAG: hypothetical protein ACOC0N_03325 [Chroococcales cyanobacterium]